MALLQTLMPGNAHYFLARYLDWLRWYDQDLASSFDTFESTHPEQGGAHNVIFKACNYAPLFANNLAIVLGVLLLILLGWLGLGIRDLILARRKGHIHKKRAPWCQNFTLRFVYEFFLEFCIGTAL